MKWIKFKDEIPKNEIIYVTDWTADAFAHAGIGSKWDTFAGNNPEYGWADIPIPKVPKKN